MFQKLHTEAVTRSESPGASAIVIGSQFLEQIARKIFTEFQ